MLPLPSDTVSDGETVRVVLMGLSGTGKSHEHFKNDTILCQMLSHFCAWISKNPPRTWY